MWFQRRRQHKTSGDEAIEALDEARKALQEVQGRGEEVSNTATALRIFREKNHFAEQLEAILLRRKEFLNDS